MLILDRTFPHETFYSSSSDQKLVPEPADEAEADRAGRPGSRLSGKRGLSVDALPGAAGVPAGPVPEVPLGSGSSSRGPVSCLLRPSTRPAVQLPSAQRLHSASGLFLPVQQPPRSPAALHHASAHGLVPGLPSVLLIPPGPMSLCCHFHLHCETK